jgi:tetratricopeptide (TPR) repeat protein
MFQYRLAQPRQNNSSISQISEKIPREDDEPKAPSRNASLSTLAGPQNKEVTQVHLEAKPSFPKMRAPKTQFENGLEAFDEKDYRKAETAFRRSIEYGERLPESLQYIGWCRLAANDAEKAHQCFSLALTLDPTLVDAKRGRAESEARLPQDRLRKARSTVVLGAQSYYEEGVELQSHGNYHMAIMAYTHAIESNTTMAEAYEKRAQCYTSVGNAWNAAEDRQKFRQLTSREPSPK